MIDVRLEAENYFRRRRISLRLRLRSLRKVCSSLVVSIAAAESGIKGCHLRERGAVVTPAIEAFGGFNAREMVNSYLLFDRSVHPLPPT
jgi:hypothetical protein